MHSFNERTLLLEKHVHFINVIQRNGSGFKPATKCDKTQGQILNCTKILRHLCNPVALWNSSSISCSGPQRASTPASNCSSGHTPTHLLHQELQFYLCNRNPQVAFLLLQPARGGIEGLVVLCFIINILHVFSAGPMPHSMLVSKR